MQNDDCLEYLQFIQKQFLCNVPVKEICWHTLANINTDIQQQIINSTVRLDSILKYPISINYQKAFLKRLLQHLEGENSVIEDSLYEEYARLVALPENNINFKHYSVEKGSKNIILKEDIHLISNGTTGLRTWQASLALSEWIVSNTTHFTSKKILELGSGIGLTGLVISLKCKPQAVCLSDCHPSVLTALCDNVLLNIGSSRKKSYSVDQQFILEEQTDSCLVSVLNLPWDNVCLEVCEKLGLIDIVVAADVVYDRTIFKPLICALDNLFKYCSVQKFILSCTERNEETLEDFLALLREKYSIHEIVVPVSKNFLWCTTPPVRIFSISQNHS